MLPHLDDDTILSLLQKEQSLWGYLQEQLPLALHEMDPIGHPAVIQAVTLILQLKGNLKISDLSERVHLSERQLQKLIDQ